MSDHKTAPFHEIWGFYEKDSAAFLDHRATARVSVACGAIQTLTAVLMQREVDAEEMTAASRRMDHQVTMGLLEAMACCAELVRNTVLGTDGESIGAVTYPADSPGAELMRKTAHKAAAMRRSGDPKGAA